MKSRRLRRPRAHTATAAVLAAAALAGCGEVTNTITARSGTANQVTVALDGEPNAFYAGIYEAEALGYFKQTDLNVNLVLPAAGQDPLTMVHGGQALVGVASEPSVLLHRNVDQPLVAVAALLQGPLPAIAIQLPRPGPSGGAGVTTTATTTTASRTHTRTATTPTTTAPTTTTVAEPDATLWPGQLQQLLSQPGYPTYNGLVLVVGKGTIVSHAPVIRRFVQAVARGYRAARAHPGQALENLIKAVPALAPSRPLQRAALTAAMPYFFPTGGKVWGWMRQSDWNSFGTWMTQQHLLNNPNAITDASTNELLQGQGV